MKKHNSTETVNRILNFERWMVGRWGWRVAFSETPVRDQFTNFTNHFPLLSTSLCTFILLNIFFTLLSIWIFVSVYIKHKSDPWHEFLSLSSLIDISIKCNIMQCEHFHHKIILSREPLNIIIVNTEKSSQNQRNSMRKFSTEKRLKEKFSFPRRRKFIAPSFNVSFISTVITQKKL